MNFMSDRSERRIPLMDSRADYRDYQRQRSLTLGDLLLENRIIFLQGVITNETANDWEIILKDVLPAMGDRWRFYVDGYRNAVLVQEPIAPLYYYDNGIFYNRLGEGWSEVEPRLMRPWHVGRR